MDKIQRYIVAWRKTPAMGSVLDWDHYVAFSLDEARQAVANILKQGVIQYYTAPLGESLPGLSCDFGSKEPPHAG